MRFNHPWLCLIAIGAGLAVLNYTTIDPRFVMLVILCIAALLGLREFFEGRKKLFRHPPDHANHDDHDYGESRHD